MIDDRRIRSLARQLKPLHVFLKTMRARRAVHQAFAAPSAAPILIYQMGKVGSSSVYHSLRQASLPNAILHLHFISEDVNRHIRTYESTYQIAAPYDYYLGRAIGRRLRAIPDSACKLISLVRDPMAFILSDLFQNRFQRQGAFRSPTGGIDLSAVNAYVARRLEDPSLFNYVFEWFDRELHRVFHIDLFSQPFPVDDGYGAYQHGRTELLVIRTENLTAVGPAAIGNFLAVPRPVKLERHNVRSMSRDRDAYRAIRQAIVVPRDVCERVYASRFVQHFLQR